MIDKDGNQIGIADITKAESNDAYKRFRSIAKSSDNCEQTYGLIRSEVLRNTKLEQNYTNSDRTLLAEIALHGKFYEIQEYLFYKRFHLKNIYLDWRTRMAWFDPSNKGKIVFPWWMQFFDYLKTIHRAPISRSVKLRCYLFMIEWILRFGKNLAKDLMVALYMILRSKEWRKQRYETTSNWT